MAFPQGVDFRQTAVFVTDPANFTHDLGTTVYPTASPQGNNIGWVATTGLSSRNRSATVDPRLAGLVFRPSATSTFKIDLPAAGKYNIAIALGDDTSSQLGQGCQIFDGATLLATPVTFPAASAAGSFYDATGTQYTAANWPGGNTKISLTFAGTTASFVFGGTSNTWAIASIYIEAASASNNGSLAETFTDFTLAGTGTAPAHGTLAETFADFTLAGAGTAPASGALSETFTDFTLAGTGSAATIGSLAVTFADFVLIGTGTNSVKRFPFFPLDPSIRDAVLVKPYSGVSGDAFGGAPAGAGYPAAAPPAAPPVQQAGFKVVPR